MKRTEYRSNKVCISILGTLVLVLAAVSAPRPVRGATITVNSTNDPGATGICTLRDAVTAANTDAAVNGCAAGKGTDTIDLTGVSGTITLASVLTISSKVSITGPGAVNLTISGGSPNMLIVEAGASLALAGLTLSDDPVNAAVAVGNQGDLTVMDCVFSNNVAGGIFNSAGNVAVNGCTFSNNGESAITNFANAKLTVSDSTFSNNTAGGGQGGAIDNFRGGLNVTGKVTVTNCSFSDNSANAGGAISNQGKLTMTNCTFDGNVADTNGGAIFNDLCGASSCPITVTSSTFSDNSTGGIYGGAIYNNGSLTTGGKITVTNSTFSGNSANSGYGGAISAWGKLKVSNSTFSGNSATAGGAIDGACSSPSKTCSATLKNTLLINNTGGNCVIHITTDGGHNLEDSTSCGFKGAAPGASCSGTKGTSLCNVTPNLDPAGLADNGGPTQTIALCTAAGTPTGCTAADTQAINAGGCRPTDQRGYKRPGIDPATSMPYKHCTIGAYEANPPRCGGKLTACRAASMCTETDLANDPASCICRNLTNDPNNCGACGNVCSSGKCSKGTCE